MVSTRDSLRCVPEHVLVLVRDWIEYLINQLCVSLYRFMAWVLRVAIVFVFSSIIHANVLAGEERMQARVPSSKCIQLRHWIRITNKKQTIIFSFSIVISHKNERDNIQRRCGSFCVWFCRQIHLRSLDFAWRITAYYYYQWDTQILCVM